MSDLLTWLRTTVSTWVPAAEGLLVRVPGGDGAYHVDSFDELLDELTRREALIGLPTESAALAKVLEGAMLDHLSDKVDGMAAAGDDVATMMGGDRHYPDLEVHGAHFAPGSAPVIQAVDIKVARRQDGRANPTKTQSRISLYTGNTYFAYPGVKAPLTLRPFGDYAEHLDILIIYTLTPDRMSRVADVECIVHPTWKIASRERSSTTREYIGAVMGLDDLRNGNGEFANEAEFLKYWRAYPFKASKQMLKILHRLSQQS